MTTQLALGYDDTIAVTGLSSVGGTAGVTGRSGSGLRCRINSSSALRLAILATALSTLYVGFSFRAGSFTVVRHMTFLAPDGTTVHFGIGFDATNHITIYGPANTVVATSASALLPNVDYYIEVKAVIHDTTGVVEVRVDESVAVSFSGDTRNGAATTVAFIDSRANGGSAFYDFDDLYIDDAGYLGDISVVTLRPNGNGSSSQWPGSDGNSTDNYQLVDESPTPNVTDYVADSVSGHLDLYSMDDIPIGYDVYGMYELIYAAKSDAGTPPTVLPVAKGQSGTTRTDTALPALSTTAQLLPAQLRTTDPDGNALTAARVNAMEVGVKIS